MYRITPQLSEKIKHFATFPQTGVSLRQMVMFGKTATAIKTILSSLNLSTDTPPRTRVKVSHSDLRTNTRPLSFPTRSSALALLCPPSRSKPNAGYAVQGQSVPVGGVAHSPGPQSQGARGVATQPQRHAFDHQSQELVCPVLPGITIYSLRLALVPHLSGLQDISRSQLQYSFHLHRIWSSSHTRR